MSRRYRKKQKATEIKTVIPLRKTNPASMNWKDLLNRTNGGHSETVLGIICDFDGNPVTGRR